MIMQCFWMRLMSGWTGIKDNWIGRERDWILSRRKLGRTGVSPLLSYWLWFWCYWLLLRRGNDICWEYEEEVMSIWRVLGVYFTWELSAHIADELFLLGRWSMTIYITCLLITVGRIQRNTRYLFQTNWAMLEYSVNKPSPIESKKIFRNILNLVRILTLVESRGRFVLQLERLVRVCKYSP